MSNMPPLEPSGYVEPNSDARLWATLVHVFGLPILVPVAFANIIVPLIIWLIKKEEHPFVDEHGKESINFQISVTIYSIIGAILCFICIGFVLLSVLAVFSVVVCILAAIKANKGEPYRYPLSIRFLK